MKKIGIMGGTFNPIHYGHLFLAENAYEQIGLDQILFMPSNNPPHKSKQDIASNEHRKTMVQLAIQDNPHFSLSTMELEREGITYTADTLQIMKEEYSDAEIYFIVGADSFLSLQNWKKPETVFKLSTIVAFGRDQIEQGRMEKHKEYLMKIYPDAKIMLPFMPTIQISSAMIRERIAEKKSIRYYLPSDVMAYIEENQLYTAVTRE
ncbi:MAG: nicotinate-nucleotide adenylyltransferase [Clostridiales bacterium]|jgi:nicotinate-nucleotide adenylyltransferase|nr:nicotinate-nucleotide adenylyltransferase [Clostridiales bacterium]